MKALEVIEKLDNFQILNEVTVNVTSIFLLMDVCYIHFLISH